MKHEKSKTTILPRNFSEWKDAVMLLCPIMLALLFIPLDGRYWKRDEQKAYEVARKERGQEILLQIQGNIADFKDQLKEVRQEMRDWRRIVTIWRKEDEKERSEVATDKKYPPTTP